MLFSNGIATTKLPCVIDRKHQFYNDYSYHLMFVNLMLMFPLIELNFYD
jgi:hypothetical protein